MLLRAIVLALAVLVFAGCGSSGSGSTLPVPQWSRERRDNMNTGIGGSLVNNTEGFLLWCRNLGSPVTTTPAIGPDGRVFAATAAGKLYSLQPGDGAVLWSFDAGSPIHSSPAVDPLNGVYFGDDAGLLHALDLTGVPLWPPYDTGSGGQERSAIANSPLLDFDFIEDRTTAAFFSTADGRVVALGPDGTLRWQFRAAGPVQGGLAMDINGTIFVPSSAGLYGLLRDGSNPFSPAPTALSPITAPSVGAFALFQPTASPRGDILAAATPDLTATRWTFAGAAPIVTSPAQTSRFTATRSIPEVVATDAAGEVYVLDQTSGTSLGRCDMGQNDGLSCSSDADCPGGSCGPIFSLGSEVDVAPTIGGDDTFLLIGTGGPNGTTLYAIQRRLCDGGDNLGLPCRTDTDCLGAHGNGNCLPLDEPVGDVNRDNNQLVTVRWTFSGDANCSGFGNLGQVVSPPSIDNNGTVYFGAADGYVYAVGGSGS